jgi:hypothetical protein
MKRVVAGLLLLTFGMAEGARAQGGSQLSATLSEAALLGMRLSVERALQQGKLPARVAKCVAEQSATSLSPTYETLSGELLTKEEIAAASSFLSSPVGRKYAKYGQLQVYAAVGMRPPEPLPDFSDAEYRELESFSRTSAGNKLMVQKVMEGPAARQAVNRRVQEIIASCDR